MCNNNNKKNTFQRILRSLKQSLLINPHIFEQTFLIQLLYLGLIGREPNWDLDKIRPALNYPREVSSGLFVVCDIGESMDYYTNQDIWFN